MITLSCSLMLTVREPRPLPEMDVQIGPLPVLHRLRALTLLLHAAALDLALIDAKTDSKSRPRPHKSRTE